MTNVTASPFPNLSDKHYAELVTSGLNDSTIKQRGYATAPDDQFLLSAVDDGKATRNQLGAGLVIPIFAADSKKRMSPDFFQVKLDEPRKLDGDILKYESPAGRSQLIDVGWLSIPTDADIVFTEGVKKADALRQVFPEKFVIGLASTCGGMSPKKKPKQLRTDLRKVLDERRDATIYLCFDSDMATNSNVWTGVDKYRYLLESNGFDVRIITLPSSGEEKMGADDLLYKKGEQILRTFFLLADKDMPPKPANKNGGGKQQSADKEAAKQVLEEYKSRIEIDHASLSDGFAKDLWLGNLSGELGERINPQTENLIFDVQTSYGYRFNPKDRTYVYQSDVAGQAQVNDWFLHLINTGEILASPIRDDFGIEGEQEFLTAHKARLGMITSLSSAAKSRNVYSLLKGAPMVNHTLFNTAEHDHLFPLSGGMSIDFSQPECPLVDTPQEARFTWCSPITGEEFEDAWHAIVEKQEMPDRWARFLDDIADGREEFIAALYAILGYFIHGRRRQWFFIFHGNSRNGKGVILRLISYLMGSNDDEVTSGSGAYEIDPKSFIGRDQRHDQHWLNHKNRRLIIAEDPKGYLNESRVLRYAGGEQIQGEVKGGANISFKPTGALCFAGQGDRIQFRLSDDAIRDRMLALVFRKQFMGKSADTTLESDLRKEGASILALIAEAAHQYHISNFLDSYDYMSQCRDKVMEAGNSIVDFWDNQDIYVPTDDNDIDPLLDVTVPNFLAHYHAYCEEYDLKPIDNRGGDVIKGLANLIPNVEVVRPQIDGTKRQFIQGIRFADHINTNSSIAAQDGKINGTNFNHP